jgi:hypothetical protein
VLRFFKEEAVQGEIEAVVVLWFTADTYVVVTDHVLNHIEVIKNNKG